MASNLLIKSYQLIPYPLKVLSTSIPASDKKKKKYGVHYKKIFEFLNSNGISHQERIAEQELEKYLTFIKYNCQFYKSYKNKGFSLQNLPIIDKATVNKRYSEFLLDKPYFISKSSGTTGQPLKVPYSKNAYQKEYAYWWYHRSFCGIHRGDRIATFAGHKITDVNREKSPFWVYNFAENQIFFSSYHLSRKNLKYYIEALNKYRPIFIHGYPSSVYYVAKYILDENIKLQFQPKMIVTSSETTLQFQRSVIDRLSDARFLYGMGILNFVAMLQNVNTESFIYSHIIHMFGFYGKITQKLVLVK